MVPSVPVSARNAGSGVLPMTPLCVIGKMEWAGHLGTLHRTQELISISVKQVKGREMREREGGTSTGGYLIQFHVSDIASLDSSSKTLN